MNTIEHAEIISLIISKSTATFVIITEKM